ncbi:hypothetical protein GF376_01335 [Candidatus Peregrinibacteria bacterium]|nr:hypothetical protein [Candidatus Peregrinibacteria bacterium]
MNSQDVLVRAIAQVRGTRHGTAFFIGEDGTLLTCFHLIKNSDTGEPIDDVRVVFDGIEYQAKYIHTPLELQRLDAAILRLPDNKLPRGAALLPLGKWDSSQPTRFQALGFRSPQSFEHLYADGKVLGRTYTTFGRPVLQLDSESIDKQTIRHGMSGSPVYDMVEEHVVGMIIQRYSEQAGERETVKEVIPLAVPIDELANFWFPIRVRLREQQLLKQLPEITKLAYVEKELRKFYERLSNFFPELTPYDDLKGKKPQALLEKIRELRRVQDLVNHLRSARLGYLDEFVKLNSYPVSFVNRKEELTDSSANYAAPFLLYEAPAGYGKTELLKAIEHEHFRKGWLCAYVKVDQEAPSVTHVLENVVTAFGYHDLLPLCENVSSVARALAAALKVRLESFERGHKEVGAILLVDNIELLPLREADVFLNQFLPLMQATLSVFRIRLAGRYTTSSWARKAKKCKLVVHPLTPFKFNAVRDTIRLKSERQLDLRAAHLMHVTGGHPGCIIEILERMNFDEPVEQHFALNDDKYKRIVLSTASQVRQSIPPKLRDVFDTLSVFRRYNYWLLERMIDDGLISYQGDARDLEKELTATYLVVRDQGFIQDEIVRRLLSIRLRWKERERFVTLCEQARVIYREYLGNTISRPEFVAIEGLYQELQSRYYQESSPVLSQEALQQEALRNEFFTDDGVLNFYLKTLASKPEAQDIMADLRTRLIREEDWEFRFVVNFYLRDDQYTNKPYQQIIDAVSSFAI